MAAEPSITLSLTHDQALVLFEWLCREDGKNNLPTEHEAEQRVLWQVEGQLESQLVDPLKADYTKAVSAARERIVSGEA